MNDIRLKKCGVPAAVLAGLCLLAATGGCRDEEPASDLDRFVGRTASLAGEVLTDTLWTAVHEGPPNSTYASFLLGNRYYQAAGDSAVVLGWRHAQIGALLDSAEVHFDRAVAQDSTFIEAMVNLGSVWDDRAEASSDRDARQEAMTLAERHYRRALAVDPADQKARCNLGSLFLRQRLTEAAITEFTTALEYDPESALAHYHLAVMFAEAEIYREAIREWELAARYDPDGDVGERSRDNVRIVKELMSAPAAGPPTQ